MSQKKNHNNNKNNNNNNNNAQNQNENKETNNNNNNKKEDETKATKVVMKIDMHCEGCSSKIIKCISGFEGVEKLDQGDGTGKLTITGNIDAAKLRDKLVSVNHVTIDKEKEIVTVKGTMDAKVLVEKLKKRFKRKVEVVQPKKDKDKDKENEKEGNKGEKSENDGGKKNNNQKGEGGNKKGDGNSGDNNAKMEMQAPQMFSDENPNACSVM
ncbi:hypothetical protein TSUD_107610 [Trifolium subterraneum]|uniref:HMA domain-containing protein n=1 Tax=Trifolium subterraneum TaxID=3900 RepID=A0A2Z6PDF8_TRISU|nr:hypothetical protein TSUD_107610 [Trifolium subterraneum]